MKKVLSFLFMAFILCQGLKAQNKDRLRYFNLVLPDNSVISYELANGIDIYFQDSIMVVNNLNLFMEEGVKYYFSEDEISAVDEYNDNGYIVGNHLHVKSSNTGNIVISDVLGRVVYSKSSCGECVIDLSSLASDNMYIIKVNNQYIKFVKR